MNWTIQRKREVTTYLIQLGESGRELRRAISSLQFGIPEDARKLKESPETWEWLEACHWITFIVTDKEQKWLYILDIESATVEH